MKKILKVAIGAIILGVGIGLFNIAELGGDPLTVFYEGLMVFFNISMGLASLIASILIIIVVLILNKKHIGIGTIITPFAMKLGIDIIYYLRIDSWIKNDYFIFLA